MGEELSHTLDACQLSIPQYNCPENELTQTMPTGPAGIEKDKVEAIDGRRPMMLKATAKIWTVE